MVRLGTGTTRRAALTGLGASFAGGLVASAAPLPRAVRRHPGFHAWTAMYDPDPLPLQLKVTTLAGVTTPLWAWMGSGPTVLILWARWCTPCMNEKPMQASMARRLASTHSATKLKFLQVYDPTSLADANTVLARIGARDLDVARAGPELERAMVDVFGPAPSDPRRTTMPSLLLIGPGGVELGRATGTLHSPSGQSYWGDATTMQFLSGLDKLLDKA